MQLERNHVDNRDAVMESVLQGTCSYCGRDSLARESYKGNDAVVCEDCGTPAAQFW